MSRADMGWGYAAITLCRANLAKACIALMGKLLKKVPHHGIGVEIGD